MLFDQMIIYKNRSFRSISHLAIVWHSINSENRIVELEFVMRPKTDSNRADIIIAHSSPYF